MCLILSLFLSVCPLSSMVPLLQLISRGSPMSFEDSNRIIPLFYLFSSLFSHSLISVHDSEFFGHELEGSNLFVLPVVLHPQAFYSLFYLFIFFLQMNTLSKKLTFAGYNVCLIGGHILQELLILYNFQFPSFSGFSKKWYCHCRLFQQWNAVLLPCKCENQYM